MNYQLLQGDCIQVLKTLPAASVHCCVTSPPYWGLRDYGTATWEGGDPTCDHKPGNVSRVGKTTLQGGKATAGHQQEGYHGNCPKCGAVRIDQQIGLEPTVSEYVAKLVEVFRDVRRVLRDDGTVWLNLGDSYNGSGGWGGADTPSALNGSKQTTNAGSHKKIQSNVSGLKPKDLIGIPWRVAFALQADGWYLRSDIIWHKPNPMPESVTDRPTKSHEYLFLLSKSERYYYDAEAIKEPAQVWEGQAGTFERTGPVSEHVLPGQSAAQDRQNRKPRTAGNKTHKYVTEYENSDNEEHRTKAGLLNIADVPWTTRNKRSVWTIATRPYAAAHFATYPVELVQPCILAGTSAHGVCAACGAPWVRTVERTAMVMKAGPSREARTENGRLRTQVNGTMLEPPTAITTGWAPSCTCSADVVPPVVLDPFNGSGTTGVAVIGLGGQYIGIDLNPDYIALAERRLSQTQPALIGVSI